VLVYVLFLVPVLVMFFWDHPRTPRPATAPATETAAG